MEVLIVEDSKFISNIVKKELLAEGHKVDQAFTLAMADEFLQQKRYDLIILDLHLPDGEGIDLLVDMKFATDSKIIVLTSDADAMVRNELFNYGILDYIIKDENLTYSIYEIIRLMRTLQKRANSKILLIDDSKFVCKQVGKLLNVRGYKVDFAHTAQEGLECLEQEKYELCILDLVLPDMEGIELLMKIRQNRAYEFMPILILSGYITPELTREVLKHGANDITKKPFVNEEFVLKVDLWIDYFQKEKELQEKNDNLQKIVQEEVEKNLEKDRMLLNQNRFAQMGEVIAMIAHQWRQPLNVVGQAFNLLRIKCKEDDIQKILQKSFENLDYLNQTIEDFRLFFKPNNERVRTSWKIILDKALKILRSTLKSGVSIDIEVKNEEYFECFENELMQVLINIIKNADDVLANNDVENPTIHITIDGRKIEIEDNAGGIDEEHIDKIFDPYFSTKGNEGTGLGLYMSKIIVEEHSDGKLNVENTDLGAKFSIEL